MKYLIPLIFLSFFGCQGENPEAVSGPISTWMINGGKRVKSEDQLGKHSVFLVVEEDNYCSGTIIADRWVVTAAHCVQFGDRTAEDVEILFGVNGRSPEQTLRTSQILVHPQYDPSDSELYTYYDIALIRLRDEIPVGFEPVALSTSNPEESDRVIAAGYGRGDFGRLNKVLLRVSAVDPNHPSLELKQSSRKGLCRGDSGGSVYTLERLSREERQRTGERYKLKLVGIPEGVGNSATCEGPGRVTSVAYFYDWILSKIEN